MATKATNATAGAEKYPLNNNSQPLESHGSTGDSREMTDFTVDEASLISDPESLFTVEQAKRWRQSAIQISIVTIVSLLVLGVASFVISFKTGSTAAFGFGFDCILDVCTSAVVIWRFYGSVSTLHSEHREHIALTFVGVLFLIASISITARDITEILDKTRTKNKSELVILAAVSGTVGTILAIGKFIIAKKLQSKTVKSDGYSSLACAITGFSILVSAGITSVHPDVWYLDNIVGFCVATLLLVYGFMLLATLLTGEWCNCVMTDTCCRQDNQEVHELIEKQSTR